MNHYDDVQIDVALAVSEQLCEQRTNSEARSGHRLWWLDAPGNYAKLLFFAVLQWSGLWRRLVYGHLVLGWFIEFRQYWERTLGNRRLELPDFYYLRGVYRQKFQALAVPDGASPKKFLAAWQRPETLGLLFAYVYKLALHPVTSFTAAKFIPRGARVCEFGCGLAPVTRDLATYYNHLRVQVTAIDIPTLLLHYTGWKFRQVPWVTVAALAPEDTQPLTETYDVIACLTVLEHVPRPLELVRHFHAQLTRKGRLIFDYRKTDGTGLDTTESAAERAATLAFIRDNFTVLHGRIDPTQENFGLVIAEKKQ